MEKIDLNIGEIFTTTDGDKYEVLASPGTDCNACKGCDFLQKVRDPDYAERYIPACSAPDGILCCNPNRIFKQHEQSN